MPTVINSLQQLPKKKESRSHTDRLMILSTTTRAQQIIMQQLLATVKGLVPDHASLPAALRSFPGLPTSQSSAACCCCWDACLCLHDCIAYICYLMPARAAGWSQAMGTARLLAVVSLMLLHLANSWSRRCGSGNCISIRTGGMAVLEPAAHQSVGHERLATSSLCLQQCDSLSNFFFSFFLFFIFFFFLLRWHCCFKVLVTSCYQEMKCPADTVTG